MTLQQQKQWDLLLFAAELVGNDRLRSGQMALSAGRPNERLWQRKAPLLVLWNHLHIASLKPTVEVAAFASLNSAEHLSTLGNVADAVKQEGEYFAMAAVHSLPEWVISDECRDLRDKYATGPCRLPTALMTDELKPSPSVAPPISRRKKNLPPRLGSAVSSSNTPTTVDVRSGRTTTLPFQ